MQQATLKFNDFVSYREEDFFVDSANNEIYSYLKMWPNWQDAHFGKFAYISGPEFSGKKHLSFIWQKLSGAKLLNLRRFDNKSLFEENRHKKAFILHDLKITAKTEENLLHLINNIEEENKFLLITSKFTPSEQKIILPDLKSRIMTLPSFEMGQPSIELIQAILFKHFTDRQLKVSFDIVAFLSKHIDRNYLSIKRAVEKIDQESLAQKKKISMGFVRSLFSVHAA